MKTSKVYDKLIRVVNVKTGNIQFISQFVAEDINLLERYGFKIDDPEYLKFLGKDVKEEKEEDINKEGKDDEIYTEDKTETKTKTKNK